MANETTQDPTTTELVELLGADTATEVLGDPGLAKVAAFHDTSGEGGSELVWILCAKALVITEALNGVRRTQLIPIARVRRATTTRDDQVCRLDVELDAGATMTTTRGQSEPQRFVAGEDGNGEPQYVDGVAVFWQASTEAATYTLTSDGEEDADRIGYFGQLLRWAMLVL